MRVFYLAVGTALMLLFVVELIRGRKYAGLTGNLDPGEYPLRGIYGVGFTLSMGRLFALRGKTREKLVGQAKMLYDPKYAEYYARVRYAQTLSFVHLCLTAGFLAAGALDSGLMLIIGVAVAVVFGVFFAGRMGDTLNSRQDDCTSELPEIVTTMALLTNAGMLLRNAWRTIAESKDGTIYTLMRGACDDMDNGMADVDAIHKFGRLSNSAEVRKFTSALAQSIEHGGGELNDFLARQSSEMLTLKKQLMLQKGEAAASKLLMPTALLFVGIIIAVFSGALGMLI